MVKRLSANAADTSWIPDPEAKIPRAVEPTREATQRSSPDLLQLEKDPKTTCSKEEAVCHNEDPVQSKINQ